MNETQKSELKKARAELKSAQSKLENLEQKNSEQFMSIPEGIHLSCDGIIVNDGRTLMEIDGGLVELTNFKNIDWDDYSDVFQLKKITFGEIVEGDRILACYDKSEYSDLEYWYVIDEKLRPYYYNEKNKTSIYETIERYDEFWKVVPK